MFSGFTFDSEVVLGSIAAFYGFQIPEAEDETSRRFRPHPPAGTAEIGRSHQLRR